jgi:hypothetical protein
MKIFCIVGFGRSGMDFLQSLFDNHPQISQFPGYFSFYEFYKLIIYEKNIKIISEIFINQYPHYFDSRLNKIEKHNKLGPKKNEHYLVNKEIFKKNFINLQKKKLINKKNILINLHFAYSSSIGKDVKLIKIIIINAHQINNLDGLNKLNYKILFMLRNPITSLNSGIKNWMNYNNKNLTPWFLFFQIKRIFTSLKEAITLNKKIYVIKLNDLHTKSHKTIKSLAKIMGIYLDKSLKISSYHGKIWWGDMLSVKNLKGFNRKYKDSYDKNIFFEQDIKCIEYYLKPLIKKYEFDSFSKNKIKFIKILPLKCEILVWKNVLLNLMIKEIFYIPYYWMKRIFIMNINIHKNLKYPKKIT